MKIPSEKAFDYSKFSQKISKTNNKIGVSEYRNEHNKDNKAKTTDTLYHQLSVFFNCFVKSDKRETHTSGCHLYVGEDTIEWFVQNLQKLKSVIYEISNESNIETDFASP